MNIDKNNLYNIIIKTNSKIIIFLFYIIINYHFNIKKITL